MTKKATIREAAARAGVSPSTVSRVLNGHGADHMRLATKERVLLAIEELDYVPVKAAQTLRRQHARVLNAKETVPVSDQNEHLLVGI